MCVCARFKSNVTKERVLLKQREQHKKFNKRNVKICQRVKQQQQQLNPIESVETVEHDRLRNTRSEMNTTEAFIEHQIFVGFYSVKIGKFTSCESLYLPYILLDGNL